MQKRPKLSPPILELSNSSDGLSECLGSMPSPRVDSSRSSHDGNLRLQQVESRLDTLTDKIASLCDLTASGGEGDKRAQQCLAEEIEGVRVDIKELLEKLQKHTVEQLNQQNSWLEKVIETVGELHDHHAQHKSSMEQVVGHHQEHREALDEHKQRIDSLHRNVVEKLDLQQLDTRNHLAEMKEIAQSFQHHPVHAPTTVEDEMIISKFHRWSAQWEDAEKVDPGGDYLRALELIPPDDRQNVQDPLSRLGVEGPTEGSDTGSRPANPDEPVEAGDRVKIAAERVMRNSQMRKSGSRKSGSSLSLPMDPEKNAVRKARVRKDVRRPDNCLTPIVMGEKFGMVFSIVIVANTVMLGVMTDIQIRNAMTDPGMTDPDWFVWVNLAFLVTFTVELIMRLGGEGCYFFFGKSRRWNVFDTFLVFTGYLELLPGEAMENLSFLRVVRTLKMFRAVRIVRVFRFFRELRLMLHTIVSSFVSLSWALALLVILIYCCAVMFCQAIAGYIQEDMTIPPSADSPLFIFYGSIIKAMFSLILAISGGTDWYDLSETLTVIGVGYKALFTLYTLFVIFGMLNVLTGFFVERTAESAGMDRDMVIEAEKIKAEHFCKSLRIILQQVDDDQSGTITAEELQQCVKQDDVQALFSNIGLDIEDADELFHMLDTANLGHVSIEDFILGSMRLKGQAKSLDLLHLHDDVQKVKRLVGLLGDQLKEVFGLLVMRGRGDGSLHQPPGVSIGSSGTRTAI